VLQKKGFATLLLDLLTSEEEKIDDITREIRFDIPLLAKRMCMATEWAEKNVAHLKIGYFGASTGAAAALIAAAQKKVFGVVSRGGRPDLAMDYLGKVKSPVLLIVGEYNGVVIELNQKAAAKLKDVKTEIISQATHLFEEPGALEEVARIAAEWLDKHAN